MKQLIKSLVGEKNLGRFDYYFKPAMRKSWGGALNAQDFRRKMYDQMLAAFPFKGIIETGTFLGTTTALFAESGLPIYTIESNPRFFAYSETRFRGLKGQVNVYLGDTLSFLEKLGNDPKINRDQFFFYLDAHWYNHLPLLEEIGIILKHWAEPVILIDDFCVPGTSYKYDDYGAGKALTVEYLAPLRSQKIANFFPALSAEQETGLKRGSVVLAREGKTAEVLAGLSALKRGNPL